MPTIPNHVNHSQNSWFNSEPWGKNQVKSWAVGKQVQVTHKLTRGRPCISQIVEHWTTYHHTDEFFGMEVISWDIQPHHLPVPSQSGWNLYWALHHTGASTRMITHKETGACSEYLNCSSPWDILVCRWCWVGELPGMPHYTQISFSRFLE